MDKLFILLEGCYYLIFLVLDFLNKYQNISESLKYSGILLCFLYSLWNIRKNNQKVKSVVISAALFFTSIADYYLLIKDEYLKGVLCFLVVQGIYRFYLLKRYNGKERGKIWSWENYSMRWGKYSLFILFFIILFYQLNIFIDVLLIAVILYTIVIIGNVRLAYLWTKQEKTLSSYLFFIGMILFLLCDIHVGIWNGQIYINKMNSNILYWWTEFARIAMWFFYLPSQVFIATHRNGIKRSMIT